MSALRYKNATLLIATAIGWGSALATKPARAADEPPRAVAVVSDESAKTQQAADLYDEARRLYDAGSFTRAAEAFLGADALVPSSEAVSNAIASSRQAQDYGLIARSAQRAIAREQSDPLLAARARLALHEAEPHLARLTAQCTPQPCTIFLNQQPLSGETYLQPGSYTLQASSNESSEAPRKQSKQLTLEAGKQYLELLQFPAPTTPSSAAAPTTATNPGEQRTRATDPAVDDGRSQRVLPQWVFFAGVAATGVLTGVTVWSGVDTLNTKSDLPSRYAPDYLAATEDVDQDAKRTDWLLGATLVTAAATVAAGILWVDWDDDRLQVGAGAGPKSGTLRLRGRF